MLNGLVNSHVNNALLLHIFSAFSEVTNAIKLYATSGVFTKEESLILSAFALGFGGACVGMQSSAFASAVGLKMRKYYIIKLLEGVLAAGVFSILYMI